ncbi:MAG: hypothetical protein AAB921_01825 [Patescibacteria group bacterium]
MKTLTDQECRVIVDGIAEYLGNKLCASDFLAIADDPSTARTALERYDIDLEELLDNALMGEDVFFRMLVPYLGKMIANNVQNALPGLALNISLPEFDLDATTKTAE